MRAEQPQPGDVLIAQVQLRDGVFDQTVVLIIDQDVTGTLGVILNQLSPLELVSVLPDWVDQVSEPRELFNGGPVSQSGAVCLASYTGRGDAEPPGWNRLFDDIGLLYLDTPVELVAGAFDDLRIFAGFASWGAGQLDAEIEQQAWFVGRYRYDDVFGPNIEGLWRRVLRRQPLGQAIYNTYTDDPELN